MHKQKGRWLPSLGFYLSDIIGAPNELPSLDFKDQVSFRKIFPGHMDEAPLFSDSTAKMCRKPIVNWNTSTSRRQTPQHSEVRPASLQTESSKQSHQQRNHDKAQSELRQIYSRFGNKKVDYWHLPHQQNLNSCYQLNQQASISKIKDTQQITRLNSINRKASQHPLQFCSAFQSGNLQSAYYISDSPKHIYLLLNNDTNSRGNTQWFYFKVSNSEPYSKYRFQIINCRRQRSVHAMGAAICLFSRKLLEKQGKGWHRGGQNIKYSPTNGTARRIIFGTYNQTPMTTGEVSAKVSSFKASWWSLEWDFTFSYPQDEVFFAYAYPYSYTQLLRDLKAFSPKLQISNQATSPLGNKIVRVFTSPITSKPTLVILARAHPAQTPSSFAVRGFLRALHSDSAESVYIRQYLNVVVYPMVNPDGVIHGNTRTSMCGVDLNRVWEKPSRKLSKEVVEILDYLKGLSVYMLVDLHSHSAREGAFFYGCCDQSNYTDHPAVRMLNIVLARMCPPFNADFSSFYVSATKRKTARVVGFRTLCRFAYTLEISQLGEHQSSLHFSVADLEGIGVSLLKSIAIVHSINNLGTSRQILPANKGKYIGNLKVMRRQSSIRSSSKGDNVMSVKRGKSLVDRPQQQSRPTLQHSTLESEGSTLYSFLEGLDIKLIMEQASKQHVSEIRAKDKVNHIQSDAGSSSCPSQDLISQEELLKKFSQQTDFQKKTSNQNKKTTRNYSTIDITQKNTRLPILRRISNTQRYASLNSSCQVCPSRNEAIGSDFILNFKLGKRNSSFRKQEIFVPHQLIKK